MKKYRFPLSTVLQVRRIEEDRAKAGLLLANREVQAAQELTEARTQHLRALPAPAGSCAPAAIRATQDRLMIAAAAASFAANTLTARRAVAATRRSEWADARMRTNALERLDDRMRAAHQLEAEREEQKLVDDLVAARMQRTTG